MNHTAIKLAGLVKQGLNEANSQAGLSTGKGSDAGQSLAIVAGEIVGNILAFVGLLFFVLVIAGGIMWMTAAGNESRVEQARKLLVAALIGLIIVLAAYAITSFITTNLVPQ